MSSLDLTQEQVFAAIAAALKAQDMEAVRDFLLYAAPRWPEATAAVMESMRVALRIREAMP